MLAEGLTLVTGADERYARCVAQLLLSVERVYDAALPTVHVWDLGMRPRSVSALRRRFPFISVPRFDFTAHPSHLRIRERALNSNGWKPLALRAVAAETHGVIFWLDSATVLQTPLDAPAAQARATGLYTPFGGAASIAELTHWATLSGMGLSAIEAHARQRASGVIGLCLEHAVARELLDAWCSAVLEPSLLCPPGASHANHRFDQSLWSILLRQATRRHQLQLTQDEIDVSSAAPCPAYRTRNKVPSYVPLAADPLVRAAYNLYRRLDVAAWRGRT